jgi:hypothetical protein
MIDIEGSNYIVVFVFQPCGLQNACRRYESLREIGSILATGGIILSHEYIVE